MANYSTTNAIPAMTSYTAPSGIVTASTESDKTIYPAWKAFDSVNTGGWNSSTKIDWLAYEFPTPIIIGKYSLNSGTVTVTYVPKAWTFEGTNDNVNWDILDTRTNEINWGYKETRYYEILNPSSYKRYRINITNTNGSSYIYLSELSMYQFLFNKKYLVMQNSQYYSIKDNTLALLGTPTDNTQKEQWFNDYGVEDLKDVLLTPDANGNKLIDNLDDQFEIRMIKTK